MLPDVLTLDERATFDPGAALFAMTTVTPSKTFLRFGDAEPVPMNDATRVEAIEALNAGKHVVAETNVISYRQPSEPGVAPNHNFVRVRSGGMRAMARSAGDTPFLRDHRQFDTEARGGKCLQGKLETTDAEEQLLHERVRLTKPSFVLELLRGELDRLSVGMRPRGKIFCTACAAEWSECWHRPGRTISRSDGTERLVELELENADKIETSTVVRPAVEGTSVGVPEFHVELHQEREMAQAEPTEEAKVAARMAALEDAVKVLQEDLGASRAATQLAEQALADRETEIRNGEADRWITERDELLSDKPAHRGHLRDLHLAGKCELAAKLCEELAVNQPFSEPQRARVNDRGEPTATKVWTWPLNEEGKVDIEKLEANYSQWPKSVRDRVRAQQKRSSAHTNKIAILHSLQLGGALASMLAADGYEPITQEVL